MVLLFILGIIGLMLVGGIFNESINSFGSTGMGDLVAILFIISLGLLIGSSVSIIENVKEENYKKGQVDALSGNEIKYEMKIQPDSSRVWVKKDEDQ